MSDALSRELLAIAANLPEPTGIFSETEKQRFIARVGWRLVRDIDKARSELPLSRIPHVFSSVDSQIVVDILANEWQAALQKARC